MQVSMHGNPFYIGVDLGGTTFKALAVTHHGQILARRSGASKADGDVHTVATAILQTVDALCADVAATGYELASVGLGMAGIIELPAGIVRRAPNLPNWSGVDVRELIQQRLDVPLAMENDANVALLGEAWLGASRGLHHGAFAPIP